MKQKKETRFVSCFIKPDGSIIKLIEKDTSEAGMMCLVLLIR